MKNLILVFLTVLGVTVEVLAKSSADLYLSFEQRLLASYALLLHDAQTPHEKNLILNKIRSEVERNIAVGVRPVVVKNFEEFLVEFKGPWPETQSLSEDLKRVEQMPALGLRQFTSSSVRVQKQIDEYLLRNLSFLKNQSSVLSQEPALLGLIPSALKSDLILVQAIQTSNQIVDSALAQFGRIGENIAHSGFASQQDQSAKIFMTTILSEYFGRLSIESKKQIISAMMAAPLELNEMARFELMVQNSGPQLQKLLQVIARQANLDAELLQVFKKLESSVRPVPWVQVQELLESEKANYDFKYFERKPLGVGTMAQVHRAKVLGPAGVESVVVRFIKPGIEARIQEDHRILMEVAQILDANPDFAASGAPKLSPVIQDLTQTVSEELNQQATVDRQHFGKKVYDKDVFLESTSYKNLAEIRVPGLIASKNQGSQFMVQEMVFGRKLDKEAQEWKDVAPDLKKSVVEAVGKIWIEELLFKTGFYHSDLHQGNFMVQLRDEAIRVNILDFGMGGRISPLMQKQLLWLGMGLELNKGPLIAKAIWGLSDQSKNAIGELELTRLISLQADILKTSGDKWGVSKWSAFVMDHGLRFPYEFVSINRGLVILDKLLEDSGSSLRGHSIAKRSALKYPKRAIESLLGEKILSPDEVVKLGWSVFNKQLLQAIGENNGAIPAMSCQSVF